MSAEATLRTLQSAYEQIGVGSLTLRREQRLVDELGLDSLQLMEVVSLLEQTFEVEIVGDRRLLEVATVGELIDLLCALTDRAAEPSRAVAI